MVLSYVYLLGALLSRRGSKAFSLMLFRSQLHEVYSHGNTLAHLRV